MHPFLLLPFHLVLKSHPTLVSHSLQKDHVIFLKAFYTFSSISLISFYFCHENFVFGFLPIIVLCSTSLLSFISTSGSMLFFLPDPLFYVIIPTTYSLFYITNLFSFTNNCHLKRFPFLLHFFPFHCVPFFQSLSRITSFKYLSPIR